MQQKRIFNILSIDGGGIKGLFAARALEQVEHSFGKKIVDHFDLICGTSTGGLIALALSLGHPASDIADFYEKRGPKIFPQGLMQRLFGTGKQYSLWNKYKSEQLRKELEGFFGTEKRIFDCKSLLCIPAYNITEGKPIVFKYPHKEGNLSRDGDLNVVNVGLATSAAPTYFKNHKFEDSSLKDVICTDGGVWCNNPALAGLLEAWTYFVGPQKDFDSIRVLSVSTIPKPSGDNFHGGGILKWKKRLVDTSLEGQSYFANLFLQKMRDESDFEVDYLRVIPESLSASQYNMIEMDLASKSAIEQLNTIGRSCGISFTTKHKMWLDEIFGQSKHYLIT